MCKPTVPGCHLMWSKGQTWETKPSTCRIWCCLQIVSESNYIRGNKPESHAELLCVVNHSVSILCCQKWRFECLKTPLSRNRGVHSHIFWRDTRLLQWLFWSHCHSIVTFLAGIPEGGLLYYVARPWHPTCDCRVGTGLLVFVLYWCHYRWI